MTGEELIEALENAGYTARSYSGRGMYGRNCIGVDLNHAGDLFRLGVDVGSALGLLGAADVDLVAPRTDSMGMGIIAYWEWIDWPEGHSEVETWDCEECGEKNREADEDCQNCGVARS